MGGTKEHVSFRIDEDLKERVAKLAREDGVHKSEMYRRIIHEHKIMKNFFQMLFGGELSLKDLIEADPEQIKEYGDERLLNLLGIKESA